MTPEGQVKEDIKKVLKAFGVWYYMPVPSPLGRSGIPDFMGILPWDGRALGVEAKAPGKKSTATANQIRFRDEMLAAGAVAIITDDAEELRELLHACKQKAQKTDSGG